MWPLPEFLVLCVFIGLFCGLLAAGELVANLFIKIFTDSETEEVHRG